MQAMKAVAGKPITYGRTVKSGGVTTTQSVVVTAIEGSKVYHADDVEDTTVEYKTRDFLIDACDLRFDGDLIQPQKGDWVKVVRGPKVYAYTVNRPNAEQAFTFSDLGQTRYRVATILHGVDNL